MARRPSSAAFDTPIALRRAVKGRDAMNGVTEAWSTFAEVLAQREPAGGGEALAGGQPAAQLVEKFLIRHTPKVADLTEADQAALGAQLYELVRVEPVTGPGRRGRYIRLHATALAGIAPQTES